MIIGSMNLGRLWRTVRWLKPEQIFGRLLLRLNRAKPDVRAAPARRTPIGSWTVPASRLPTMIGPGHFRFLGQEHDLDSIGWDNPRVPLLWRYNLHYFDDLNAAGALSRVAWHNALITAWLADNPPARGTAWAPYPTSLRVVNWAKWFLGGQDARADWLESLAVQTRWLAKHLEWHLLGNHLFANAKALVFAGLLFEGEEAQVWLATGIQILTRELPEQFLPDGGHFELTPMYHALAFEDLLDLINILLTLASPKSSAAQIVPPMRAKAGEMLHWLRCMTHPDGTLGRFNDCADGIAPSLAELERYAEALGITAPAVPTSGLLHFPESGYVRVSRQRYIALLDVAPIGPDYLPGHAHADTLSFELSLNGCPLIVNRGTSVYGEGPRRLLERGTAAHSTLQIGSEDSSEVWSSFRVGRRARMGAVQVNGWNVSGSHDGWSFLPNSPRHHRRWDFEEQGVRVEDHLTSVQAVALVRYHLSPGFQLLREDGSQWQVINVNGRRIARVFVSTGEGHVETWEHAAGFGQLVAAETLVVRCIAGRAGVQFTWEH